MEFAILDAFLHFGYCNHSVFLLLGKNISSLPYIYKKFYLDCTGL